MAGLATPANLVRLATLVILAAAATLHIVSLASKRWWEINDLAHGGLWKVCQRLPIVTTDPSQTISFTNMTCSTYPASASYWRLPGEPWTEKTMEEERAERGSGQEW